MNKDVSTFAPLAWKTIVVHTVTYFFTGIVCYVVFDYPAKFSDPTYAGALRPLNHPLVMAGPIFQPIRGLLFAVVFYLLRDAFFSRRSGWQTMWNVLLILGILSPFGPAPCSIEGMIYTPFPFWAHITGLPETVVQSLLLAYVLHYWVNHPNTKWLTTVLHVGFAIVIVFCGIGLLVKSNSLARIPNGETNGSHLNI